MAGDILDNRGRGEAAWSWPSVHPEGRVFALIAGALSLGAALFAWETLAWPLGALVLGILAFFRDPKRVTPQGDKLVVSPADGLITLIKQMDPPRELVIDDGTGAPGLPDAPVTRISIFMSVFDVHINRTPVGGRISKIVYTPGLFLNADLDKASQDNERNAIVVETAHGPIACVQIAGLIARRILCFVREGEELAPGARFGLIRFGSRTDIYLPDSARALVAEGQRAIGGETVLCDLGSKEPQRSYRVS